MVVKTVKIVSPQGIASYEDVVDLEGVIRIAINAYLDGNRTPGLVSFLDWIGKLKRTPTSDEFAAWAVSKGIRLIPMDGSVSNVEN